MHKIHPERCFFNRLFGREVCVHEPDERGPVEILNVMLPSADVVSDPFTADGSMQIRHGCIGRNSLKSEEPVDFRGFAGGEELPLRIGPGILFRARDVDRARGDEGDEFMLIDRKRLLAIDVVVQIKREPVRKCFDDPMERFALFVVQNVPGQRGAAAAGVV